MSKTNVHALVLVNLSFTTHFQSNFYMNERLVVLSFCSMFRVSVMFLKFLRHFDSLVFVSLRFYCLQIPWLVLYVMYFHTYNTRSTIGSCITFSHCSVPRKMRVEAILNIMKKKLFQLLTSPYSEGNFPIIVVVRK